ncbi:MAG: alanine racemase [Rhodocyclales bacterium]|nr:alanine racemase [Rhodocyclales bacterium]
MTRPIRATIDLSALRGNFAVARRHAGAARLWAVVKAHAYGHGLLRAARALGDVADGFALLDIGEAVALREAGLRQPILLLEGFFGADELPLLAEHRLTPVLHSLEQVEMLASVALPSRLPIYLKLNTGMNRLGFSAAAFPAVLAALERAPQVEGITLMTHFADADGERGITEQLARFAQITAGCRHPVSLANSAALLHFPETRAGWARPGIMLYGASPYPDLASAEELGLRPAMTLSSELIAVHELQPGERVGYGGLFTAAAPMRVGTVACGYADGYPRHAPTGTPVLVAGRCTRTLGRVSMDMLAVDLTNLPEAGVGQPVVLWGEGLPVEEVAAAAGTISYELLCALAPRVPVVEKP